MGGNDRTMKSINGADHIADDLKPQYRLIADKRRRKKLIDIFPIIQRLDKEKNLDWYETKEDSENAKLADDYKKKGLFDNAIDIYTHSLRSCLQKEENDPLIKILLGRIGNTHFSNEDETTALAYFLVSHRMFIESDGESHPICIKQKKIISTLDSALLPHCSNNEEKIPHVADKVAHLEKNIGYIHMEHGRYETAHKFYQNAYRVEYADKGTHATEVADILVEIADLYEVEGKNDKAMRTYEQAVSIYNKHKESKMKVSKTLQRLGKICFEKLGEYEMALDLYKQASRVMIDSVMTDSNGHLHQVEIAKIQIAIGTIQMYSEKFTRAKEHIEKALSIYCYILGEDHERVAHVYIRLGVLRMKMNNTEQAIAAFNSALKIFHHNGLSSQHPLIIEIKKNLKRAEFFLTS